MSASLRRIDIVGLPNSGKSQLFNSLTGAYDIVSNYPQTTVEVARHRIQVDGVTWEFADTPGLHGLYIQSEEELAVRALLFAQPPDIIIQCVDANRFRESLLLTADLLNLGLPLVLVLTAVGETAQRGIRMDSGALSRLLGVPVIASPSPGAGTAELTRVLRARVDIPAPPSFGPEVDAAIAQGAALLSALPPGTFPRASAILLLENDPSFRGFLIGTLGPLDAGRAAALESLSARLLGRAPLIIEERRAQWVDGIAAQVSSTAAAPRRAGFSGTFARLCRHPLYGLPILAFFLGLIYVMVVYVAGALSLLLTTTITDPVVRAVDRLLPPGLWQDLLIGSHGLLTLGLFNSLTTVLPILAVFFFVFGLLEDIGYLPNLAILTRRVLAKIGITGNAVIPLVLGFGCKTMATMTTRTLKSRKEKLIAVALIAFAIPCSAQMGISIAILGEHGVKYFVIAFGLLALAEVVAGLVLNRIIPDDTKSAFIQELPPIRFPSFAAVARKTGYRLVWFLREAIPIFLIAALAMFLIDLVGFLGVLRHALSPVMTGWLGLPLDMVDALLLTLARSEAAAGMILRMSQSGALNGAQSIVAVILLTMFAQCFANIAAMFKEVGARAGIAIVVSIYIVSIFYAGGVHELLALTSGVLKL
jgi:ferrous iron transport protein B